MEHQSKWIVTENKISQKNNVTQNRISPKKMSLKIKCQSEWNVT